MRFLSRVRRLRKRDAALLMQATKAVLWVRWYLLRKRHHDLRRLIDAQHVFRTGPVPRADLAEVAWSVSAAARLVPGATCLTQASAGQLLLARRGFATTIRLSVPARADRPGSLAPHAWLMAGDTIVLGGTPDDYDRHRPLHDFNLPGRRP